MTCRPTAKIMHSARGHFRTPRLGNQTGRPTRMPPRLRVIRRRCGSNRPPCAGTVVPATISLRAIPGRCRRTSPIVLDGRSVPAGPRPRPAGFYLDEPMSRPVFSPPRVRPTLFAGHRLIKPLFTERNPTRGRPHHKALPCKGECHCLESCSNQHPLP